MSSPAIRAFFVDDGVPGVTIELLVRACQKLGVEPTVLDAKTFTFNPLQHLVPGDLLYRPAVSGAAMRVESHLYRPGVVTFRIDPASIDFDVGEFANLQRSGLPMPKTYACATTRRSVIRSIVERIGPFPIVAKIPGGERGVGVFRIDSLPSLFSFIDYALNQGSTPQLMEYLQGVTHIRAVVVGDAVVATYRNTQDADDFRTSPSRERSDYGIPLSPEQIRIAVAAAHAVGVDLAGVDLLVDGQGSTFVTEANFPCFHPQAELMADLPVSEAMIRHLLEKLKETKELAVPELPVRPRRPPVQRSEPPSFEVVSSEPRLFQVENFVTEAEIAHVLALSQDEGRRARTRTTTKADDTGFSFEMAVGDDPVLSAIRERIHKLLGYENDEGSTFRFRRYASSESHPPHVDAYVIQGSHLITTALICLEAPEAGGATEFPNATGGTLRVFPKRGKLVAWSSYTQDGQVDPQSLHQSAPVERGEKVTLTAFVYKPKYFASRPIPALRVPDLGREIVCVGKNAEALRAWKGALEFVGFRVHESDLRGVESPLDADGAIPVDLNSETRRRAAQTRLFGPGTLFLGPQYCTDPLAHLARTGFDVVRTTPCHSADPDRLSAIVDHLGGFPCELFVGSWIPVPDVTTLVSWVQTALRLKQGARVRAPLDTSQQRWIAVAGERVFGPCVEETVAHSAVLATRALGARTAHFEYVQEGPRRFRIVQAQGPADLRALPESEWDAFCLAVAEMLRSDLGADSSPANGDRP